MIAVNGEECERQRRLSSKLWVRVDFKVEFVINEVSEMLVVE